MKSAIVFCCIAAFFFLNAGCSDSSTSTNTSSLDARTELQGTWTLSGVVNALGINDTIKNTEMKITGDSVTITGTIDYSSKLNYSADKANATYETMLGTSKAVTTLSLSLKSKTTLDGSVDTKIEGSSLLSGNFTAVKK
jgi:hypothetical protein